MNKLLLSVAVAAGMIGATTMAFAGQGGANPSSQLVAQQPLNVVGQYTPSVGAPPKLAYSRIAGDSAGNQANRTAGTTDTSVIPEQFADNVAGQSYPQLLAPSSMSRASAVQAVSAWHPGVAPTTQVANGSTSLQFPMGD